MWIFTRYGFYSTACAYKPDGSSDRNIVMVRARRMVHLETLRERFPAIASAEILTTEDRHYRYRILVPKGTWVAVISDLVQEQEWSDLKKETVSFQGAQELDYVRALRRVGDTMLRLQSAKSNSTAPNLSSEIISNAAELTADDLAQRKVLCPKCSGKVFVSWPEGWDGHAGHACTIAGATPEERKANYKQRYRALFRR